MRTPSSQGPTFSGLFGPCNDLYHSACQLNFLSAGNSIDQLRYVTPGTACTQGCGGRGA